MTGARACMLQAIGVAALGAVAAIASVRTCDEIPNDLLDTGLYTDIESKILAEDVIAFEPQYPLWTDGAAKHRWISIPKGAWIDASDPDHFVFPIGTRLWKEFGFERRIETRFMMLGTDRKWRFATYVWSADERSATLAPERGVPSACDSAPGVRYDVPSRSDCLACHAAGPNTVLGFTALQLSSDRDPLAPHAQPLPADAHTLDELVRRRIVTGLPAQHVETPPRIAARTPRERAALGYLSSNCGTCHSSTGELVGLGLDLSYSLSNGTSAAMATTVDRPSRFRWPSDTDPLRIHASKPEESVLTRRMGTRQPLSQMPPLGTRRCDTDGLALVTAWIREDLAPSITLNSPSH